MSNLSLKPLAIFILGITIFLLLLYWGLNAAEEGIRHTLALEAPARAMRFQITDNGIFITFAGKRYAIGLDFRQYYRSFFPERQKFN